MTLAALDEYIEKYGIQNTIEAYQDYRQEYYEGLKHFATFGRGWTRRNEETTAAALDMV